MDKEYYKLEVNFLNTDDTDSKVVENGNLNRENLIKVYAILVIKAEKMKEDWLNDSNIPLDVAEKQFDEYVEYFTKEHYEEV